VQFSQPRLTGLTVSGEAAVIPWVSAVLRAGLYTSIVDSVFVGVSPYGKASLWGALPTPTCDVDGDGLHDLVTGTMLDADLGVRVLAGFSSDVIDTIRNFVPFNSNNASGDENPLMVPLADLPFHSAFVDARQTLGPGPSAVLNPLARPDGSAQVGQEVRVRFRMNDCYPYPDAMQYRIEWGDGTAPSTVTFAPLVETSAGHVYSTSGPKTVKVTAVRDDHAWSGRLLGRSRTLTINVAP
jgi:hypothetical protein